MKRKNHLEECALLFLALMLCLVAQPFADARPADSPQVIIAVGDVHGDFDDFCRILKHMGLIDDQLHWTGGKTTLVQTGDLLDRGPKEREAMDLLAALEKEAPKSGGRVVALLGNHEMMNLIGDLRYVTKADYASFADPKSDRTRKKAYEEYVKWREEHKSLLAEVREPAFETTEEEWMSNHPPGFVEQRKEFSPGGRYGKWIRERDAVAEINGVLFAHGGIAPDFSSLRIKEINSRIRDEMRNFDEAEEYLESAHLILPFFTLDQTAAIVRTEVAAAEKKQAPASELDWSKLMPFLKIGTWLSVRQDGPLWFRGYDRWTDEEGPELAEKVLKAYKAEHIVVAHTVQKAGHIRARFGGEVFLIDTGMLSSYWPGGRPSALEIQENGRITAKYLDGEQVLVDGSVAQTAQ